MFKVPIHSKKPEEGTIDYLFEKETVADTEGFFSFTFYLDGEITRAKGLIYIIGIYIYSQILKKDPFTNWKILIYTDQYSYDRMKKFLEKPVSKKSLEKLPSYEVYFEEQAILWEQESQRILRLLFNNPDVLFAIVSWPSQTRREKINGFALRPFRSRAPFDFPDKFIFIRDADTLFQSSLNDYLTIVGDMSKRKNTLYYSLTKKPNVANEENLGILNEKKLEISLNYLIDTIGNWEKIFYSEVPEIQKHVGKPPLIVGAGYISSGELYLKPWHANELLKKKAPFGIFAGFVNAIPGNPLFQTNDAWDEFIDYQTARSYAVGNASTFQLKYSVFTPENEERKTKELMNEWKKKNEYGYERNKEYLEEKEAKLKNMKANRRENAYSNNERAERIGRDEQLYLFLFLPKILDSVYFYKIILEKQSISDPKVNYNFHQRETSIYENSLKKGFETAKGGKRRNRTLRLKFEKRKTRKLR